MRAFLVSGRVSAASGEPRPRCRLGIHSELPLFDLMRRGAIIVVKQGSLTVYSAVGSKCETTTYSAGQAFIERPGEIDDVLNTSTSPYVLLVTFPRVPQGESTRTDEPDPGTCPGI